MTPADHAAYAALDLAPGTPWAVVQAAWRDLVKRHHPDRNGLDDERLREINAAYAHLTRREAVVEAGPGRLVCRRRGAADRRALWDLVWDPRHWVSWMPGVHRAAKVLGTCDQRREIAGHWGGHRFAAILVLTGMTPPCRLSGRILELRIDGRNFDLGLPPRVSVRLDAVDGGTDVELALALPSGDSFPPVLQAALQAALVELVDLAVPLVLPEPPRALEELGEAA